jgi:hypothetical protein
VARPCAGLLWVITEHSVRPASRSSQTAIESRVQDRSPSCCRPAGPAADLLGGAGPAPRYGWLSASEIPASGGAYRYVLINRRSRSVSTGLVT